MKFILFIFTVNLIGLIHCTHFYGGSINWKVVNTFPNGSISVSLDYRFYWRSAVVGSVDYRCDDSRINSRFLIGENTNIACNVSCAPNNYKVPSKIYCDGYSTSNNWSTGKRSELITLSSSQFYTEANYIGRAWLDLQYGGENWELRVKINLTTRSDINKINTPPIGLTNPIMKLKLNCNSTFRIPVFDQDGDKVKCRFATGNECGDICEKLPGAILDSEKCMLTFRPNRTGYYAAAFQIEDFSDQISTTTPLSSIPIQFLINVVNKSCDINDIYFHELTFAEDSCIGVEFNQTYNGKIIVYSLRPLTEITTLGPEGLKKSTIKNYNNNSTLWYIDISWLPNSPSQMGTNMFCFQGVNDEGLTTDQRCVKLFVSQSVPVFSNPYPTGLIDIDVNSYTTFNIKSSTELIQMPTDLSYIYIYNKGTNQEILRLNSSDFEIIDFSTVQFNVTNNYFTQNETYFILFDSGVAKGIGECGLKSKAINDSNFWTFTIKNKESPTTLVFDDTTSVSCTRPFPIFLNPFPTGLIDPDVSSFTTFKINSSNELIEKSTDLSFIYIYLDKNNQEILRVNSSGFDIIDFSTLEFNVTNNYFSQNETYFILIDTGVAKGIGECGLKSKAINDSDFWTFTIKNKVSLDKIVVNDTNSVSCINTNSYWFIILWIVIAVLILLIFCLTCALCYLLGYVRRMKRIHNCNSKTILVKGKEENLEEEEIVEKVKESKEKDDDKFKFYIKRSQEYGYKCVTIKK